MNNGIKMRGSYRETSRNLQYGLHKDESGPTKNPLKLGGCDKIPKLELSHSHLRVGAQYIYKQFLFYRYPKNFEKKTPPPPKNLFLHFALFRYNLIIYHQL